ncbi:MAG: thiosulfate oxidation carrier protein SoxY [Methylobacterium sp.]|nr:thiosulfate oxidation carrier protein SoxY [Methylobacterium sp.]
MNRRTWMKTGAAALGLLMAVPLRALAAAWNRAAFESTSLQGALDGLQASPIDAGRDIVLVAPDLAENGAIVQIEVESRIPGTEAIAVLVEKNPTPLIANFVFSNGAEPYVVTRIKMSETSALKAVVKVGERYYSVSKQVEVAVGGCG